MIEEGPQAPSERVPVLQFALPDHQHAPSSLSEGLLGSVVALDVPVHFRGPVVCVRLWDAGATAAVVAVPPAAMHEDHGATGQGGADWGTRQRRIGRRPPPDFDHGFVWGGLRSRVGAASTGLVRARQKLRAGGYSYARPPVTIELSARGWRELEDRDMNTEMMTVTAKWKDAGDSDFQTLEMTMRADESGFGALDLIQEELWDRAGLVSTRHVDSLFGTLPPGFDAEAKGRVRNLLDHDEVEVLRDGEPWVGLCKGEEIEERIRAAAPALYADYIDD